MSDSQQERIHPPTPRHRQKARQEGRVARSRDLVAAGVLLAGLAAAWVLGADLLVLLRESAAGQFGSPAWLSADTDFAVDLSRGLVQQWSAALLPLLGCLLLAAVGSQVVQFGFLFLPQRVALDVARIDPAAGCRRLLSSENGFHTALAAAKLLAVVFVAGWSVWSMRDRLLAIGTLDVGSMASAALQILAVVAGRMLLALLVLAAVDYGWQRWRYERGLRMTASELREELRDGRSDPLVGRRRRQLQQQMLQEQVARQVPRADVVIIAGATLAVAVKYNPQAMAAPQVIAKGVGQLAAHVHQVAQQHGIWTVQDRRLARELYRRVWPGQDLPPDLYPAMAAILAELPRYRQQTN